MRMSRMFGEIESVGVLHRELPRADDPRSRARIVAPLGLNLEDELGELAVGGDLGRSKAGDDLLVSHREDHVPIAPVLKARELCPDRLVPAALLPELCRVHDGEG